MKKIVITGPESTGKSTLAKELSESLFIPFVREFAREYLVNLDRKYTQEDLTEIAKGQLELEKDILSFTPSFLLCDTDLLTLKIWSEYKYGNCADFIIEKLNNNLPDVYFITAPDFPWEADKLRENPNDRDALFEIYQREIQALEVPFVVLKGSKDERLHEAMEVFNF